MDKVFEYVAKEWGVFSQAPVIFAILLAMIFFLAYAACKWRYSALNDQAKATTEQVKAENGVLKERLTLRAEQTEHYKERALKFDSKAEEVVDSTEADLQTKSLTFVSQLREFIERYKREEESIRDNDWAKMQEASPIEKDKLWQNMADETSRLSNDRNSEYSRRFKIDAMLLRDELRSRLPEYVPQDAFSDILYERPTNFFGFEGVADDIEKMAKRLVTNNK